METKIVCVPEHYVKTTKKTVYGSGCEPFCPGCCHGLFGHCDCDCGHCGPALTRRYLTKKVYTCEKDAVKCVPQEVLVSEGEGLLHRGCPCRHGNAQYEVPTVAAQVPTVAAQVPTVAAPMGSVAAPPPPPRTVALHTKAEVNSMLRWRKRIWPRSGILVRTIR